METVVCNITNDLKLYISFFDENKQKRNYNIFHEFNPFNGKSWESKEEIIDFINREYKNENNEVIYE